MANERVRSHLDRVLVLEVARVTEAAAIAAARWRGRGKNKEADKAAVDAMRRELGRLHIKGRIVIGEGEMDDAPMLFIGERVGMGDGPEVDIAVDPLEGTTICAKDMPNALAVLAIAERGGLLNAPDMYMHKIAIGPGYPDGIIDLDDPPAKNLERLAKAKSVPVSAITACILDRPRHHQLIEAVREAGAAVRLISDGDIAGVIWTTDSAQTGVDIYLGAGGAPEGVLAAAALRCIGGQMQGRLAPELHDEKERAQLVERARKMGITDMGRKYSMQDMAAADVIFSASGVTDGSLVMGVHFRDDFAETETVVMRSETGTVRRIKTTFRNIGTKLAAL
ncbi:MAG TPA: class II fructose-bisphosphatase [Hyphomicrobiaceae bacterium]|nr:class II fructose-bisphosphatase [Hyphomicrobiaceae bacterium]